MALTITSGGFSRMKNLKWDDGDIRGKIKNRWIARNSRLRVRIAQRTALPMRGWLLGCEGGSPWVLSRTKRITDSVFATLMVLASMPCWLLVMLVIKLEGPGPLFFYQSRTGILGRRFRMIKFRTMVPDAELRKSELLHLNHHEPDSPDFKIIADPRVTRVGRFLRRYSLDELPNLINVIKGDMRLVGPRPTSFAATTYQDWHLKRLAAPPGITGLWQINGRCEIGFDQRVELDTEYIDRQSPWLDIKILLLTPMRVLDGKGAY